MINKNGLKKKTLYFIPGEYTVVDNFANMGLSSPMMVCVALLSDYVALPDFRFSN